MPIASRQHAVVKEFRAVARGDDPRILLDGWHLLREALDAGIAIDAVAVERHRASADESALLARVGADAGTRLIEVTTAVMAVLSPVRTPTGVVAIARRPAIDFSALLLPAPALVIVAIDVQDPGNAGAIVRAAEAGGATGVCFTGSSADAWGWKALRASMGSMLRLPVISLPVMEDAIRRLRAHDLVIAATVAREGVPMSELNLARPVALLVGSEGTGLSAAQVAAADARITIPMTPPVESLNVAVATGVLVFEARRQRRP